MGFDYAKTAATATRLLGRFGAAAVLKKAATGAYNPGTGGSAVTFTDHAITMVALDYEQSVIDGTQIKVGDQRALIAPAAPLPATGDKIVWQGKTFSVIKAATISPAGVPVLHEAQIRA